MNRFKKIFILLFGVMACMQIQAQDKIVNPDISYAGTPRTLKIGGINVSGLRATKTMFSQVSQASVWAMRLLCLATRLPMP